MASSDPLIRQIERTANERHPRDREARFAERNRLRAAYGLPPERRKRGGLAGVYDRNKHIVAPVVTAVGTALGVGALARVGSMVASSMRPEPLGLAPPPQASYNPTLVNVTSSPSTMLLPAVGPILQSAARTTIGSTIAGAASGAVNTIATGLINRFLPPPPPTFGPQGGIPQPKEGVIGRTISRILPGGMTGREWTPVNDMTDRVGRPIAVYPAEQVSVRGPNGYVMVTMNGQRIAMLRHFAIRAGLYTAPPKPPVSGADMRAITRAAAASKRVRKLAGKVGFRCERKGSVKVLRAFASKHK